MLCLMRLFTFNLNENDKQMKYIIAYSRQTDTGERKKTEVDGEIRRQHVLHSGDSRKFLFSLVSHERRTSVLQIYQNILFICVKYNENNQLNLLLTCFWSWLTWTIHRHFDCFHISCHLRRIRWYCYGDCETLACEMRTKWYEIC